MKILKPKRLRQGDVIGIVAPASPVYPEDKLERAATYIESLGYRVKFGKAVRKVYGYLAGTDQERARDLNEMFADKQVSAIFCLRGGYGSPRLLSLLDYYTIARNPKIFVGFSDITALSCALFAKCGLISFSGPMLASDMTHPDDFAQEHLWRMLTSASVYGALPNHSSHCRVALKAGEHRGRLISANLSLFTTLIGTPYLPKMQRRILVIEDVGEEPYRIDRMLSQVEHSQILSRLGGLVIGQITDFEPEDDKPTLSMEEVIAGYVKKLPRQAPAFANLSFGHIKHKLTLPFGAKAMLHVSKKSCSLEIVEKVVV
ncbi:MAG: LD-carboxypeptidase [Chloroherpetonaceae bacterium]|nr:LD-carboxypeptidase [Chloroherpetonaceae bacterium]MCS7210402.1 LD-carboxypeptidase [Chloroherpetonaceae bacterium]MDW8019279.1 LD-carboxypeptidase [Chloroherpetonaceae bacterium]MDW8466055.1 LD-carboxypeptidase [Chloroherpetonaceae bacterium]